MCANESTDAGAIPYSAFSNECDPSFARGQLLVDLIFKGLSMDVALCGRMRDDEQWFRSRLHVILSSHRWCQPYVDCLGLPRTVWFASRVHMRVTQVRSGWLSNSTSLKTIIVGVRIRQPLRIMKQDHSAWRSRRGDFHRRLATHMLVKPWLSKRDIR